MKTVYVKEAPVTGIVAGKESNFEIRSLNKLHSIELRCLTSGNVKLTRTQMIADIELIQIRRGDNKEIIFERSGAEILNLDYDYHNDVKGNIDSPGMLFISFDRDHMPTEFDTRLTGIGMADMKSLQVRIKYAADTVSPAHTSVIAGGTIDVTTEWENVQQGLGTYIVRRRYSQAWAAANKQTINTLLQQDIGGGILALHIDNSTGTTANVTVTKNDKDLVRELVADQVAVRSNKAGRSPQSGWFHVDFALGNDPLSFMTLADLIKFLIEIDWTNGSIPTNYVICSEELKGITPTAA